MLLFTSLVSAADIYFKLCKDSSCNQETSSFSLKEVDKIYLKGYNIGSGDEIYFDLLSPYQKTISFNWYNRASIDLTSPGKYTGIIRVNRQEGFPFTRIVSFYVSNNLPSVTDSTNSNVDVVIEVSCGDAGELVYEGSVSRIFSGERFNYSKSRDLISSIQGVNMVLESGNVNNWQCPPIGIGEGIECGEKTNRTVYVSYSPNRDLTLCSQPERKSVSVFGGILFSGDDSKRTESIENLMEEVRNDFVSFTCNNDCNKRMRIGKLRTESPLFGILGDKYYYDYELRCERESNLDSDWSAEIIVSEVKSCEEV